MTALNDPTPTVEQVEVTQDDVALAHAISEVPFENSHTLYNAKVATVIARHRLATTPTTADYAAGQREAIDRILRWFDQAADRAQRHGNTEGVWLLAAQWRLATAAIRAHPVKSDVAGVPYLSDHFEWAAPGDRQEDAWLVRFCDNDVRDALYTGPEAEAEARAAWERHAPGYNMYLFRLARLTAVLPPPAGTGEVEQRLREALEPIAHWYQSDEHEERPLFDVLNDIVADLQHDREQALLLPKLRLAGANLSVCAQTTGGVAGPDAGLMLAIQQWAEAEASVRAALSSKEKGNG